MQDAHQGGETAVDDAFNSSALLIEIACLHAQVQWVMTAPQVVPGHTASPPHAGFVKVGC